MQYRLPDSVPELATRYRVVFRDVHRHLIEVEMTVPAPEGPTLDLIMPIWTPGSYLVREYSRHVHEVAVRGHGGPLPVHKSSKNVWRVELEGAQERITVRYLVYAFEKSVRSSYVDADRAFISPAGLFMWADGRADLPHIIEFELPESWRRISTALALVPGTETSYQALDFDDLVDSPIMLGNQSVAEFRVRGVPHRVALSGHSEISVRALAPDLERITETVLRMFGEVPYEHYTFLVHATDTGFGGLEHHNSCALLLSRYALISPEQYWRRWLSLVCHEFFHVFNVKRIRPHTFSNFDYTQEIYTRLLWVAEGTTAYYDNLLVMRAGLTSPRQLLDLFGEKIARLLKAPGRKVQTLEEASFDAWIKFYRADEESQNSTVSYYLKGSLVTWMLDLEIRRITGGERSMDDVMRALYRDYQGDDYGGMNRDLFREVVDSVAGESMRDFFDAYVHGTEEIDFERHLAPFGLRLVAGWKRSVDGGPPPGGQIGIDVRDVPGRAIVSRVRVDTPAARAGLYVGDEIIAINGHRAWTEEGLRERFMERRSGQMIRITLARGGMLRDVELVLAPWPPDQFRVEPVEDPSEEARARLRGWLGDDLGSLGI